MKKKGIFTLIHDDLKRLLILSLSACAGVLMIYSFVSFREIQSQTTRFLMSHVQRLAQAGVTGQDINDIDSEVARFAATWKETEDIDLRVDLFLDNKLISHAGQLLPFTGLSTVTKKDLVLPSGNKLRAEVEINLTEFVISSLALLLACEGAIGVLFYVLRRSLKRSIRHVTTPLESKIAWLKRIANDLPGSARDVVRPDPTGIIEIDTLGSSIVSLMNQIVALENNLATVNFDRGRLKVAEQVAHNIQGVIATLQLKIGTLPAASEVERNSLMDCISSLQSISKDLLRAKKAENKAKAGASVYQHIQLPPVLRGTVSQKKAQYEGSQKVRIALECADALDGVLFRMNGSALGSAVGNLIDNSVEALPRGGGTVKVRAEEVGDCARVLVIDDGKGIPSHVLPHLMREGVSFGKRDGNGIGLAYAKEVVESAGGKIEIRSLGRGTTVELMLPIEKSADPRQAPIRIPVGGIVVCVDDDALIQAVYRSRLSPFREQIKMVHLTSVDAFKEWIKKEGFGEFGARVYLFDYDLKDEAKRTGIDLISDHGLALESVLISGMADEQEILERAKNMGLRSLNKDKLDAVSFVVEGEVSDEQMAPEAAAQLV